jgi:hypothetical protein
MIQDIVNANSLKKIYPPEVKVPKNPLGQDITAPD